MTTRDQPCRLNPGRQAIRALAITALIDAHASGDADAFDRASYELADLNERLHVEELAELGGTPPTAEGIHNVLDLAARIIEALPAEIARVT